ncbi:fimbrial protein [Rahnella bonaserana]|jgi:type 1 fimbria pilin|nr:fimbrial protein [Rahnella bonaserana]MCL9642850.1 fimbrial protein [Rahnella victoriana]WHZ39659.1 fimbrial protein [Rahnella bonaserana]
MMTIVKKIVMLGCLLAGLSFLSPAALAANTGCTSSPDVPAVASLGNIAVDASLPVGSLIPGSGKMFTFNGNCAAISGVPQGAIIITCYYGSGTEISGMPGVYNTGVSGIGVTLVNSAGQRVVGGGANCDTRNTPLGYISNTAGKTFSVNITLALVKTAATIGTGSLNQSQTNFGIGMYNTGWGLGSSTDSSVSYSGNIIYRSVSCSTGSTVPVPLGDIPVSAFSGPGSTAGDRNFLIPVTCDNPVNIAMSMSSPAYVSKPNGVMAINSGTNNATGIGVQMLFNNMPVTFDNYFQAGAVSNSGGTLNAAFTARYYQFSDTVIPGQANASATVTLAYQ